MESVTAIKRQSRNSRRSWFSLKFRLSPYLLEFCPPTNIGRLVPITTVSIFRDNASDICLEWWLDLEDGDDAGTSSSSSSSSSIDSRPLTTFCAAVSRLEVLYHDAAKCMPPSDKRSQPIRHLAVPPSASLTLLTSSGFPTFHPTVASLSPPIERFTLMQLTTLAWSQGSFNATQFANRSVVSFLRDHRSSFPVTIVYPYCFLTLYRGFSLFFTFIVPCALFTDVFERTLYIAGWCIVLFRVSKD